MRGSSGLAGEFGHITLLEDGLECACGNRGCWEMYASNSAPVRYYAQAATRGRNKSDTRPSTSGPSFDDLLRLAEQGDAKANEAFDQMAHYLVAGIAMLVTGLAPDVVVVVGEVTRLWNRMGAAIKGVVESRVFSHARARIVPTDPSTQPRLRGTIALILQKHFGAPAVA